ncbi:MAG: S8 family serine peptidase [Deltaproteobacteria bacterium]|nr:S8 family serine peptidase [Deltaproteobacteria bacterium]
MKNFTRLFAATALSFGLSAVTCLARAPNDLYYGKQWGLNNTSNQSMDINAPEAWDRTTGQSNSVVAVIGSGIDLDHPDLKGKLWVNASEKPGNGVDDDGNGFIDDYNGYDCAYNDAYPQEVDSGSRGTAAASIIGASSNNAIGTTGVNWAAKLMILNVQSGSSVAVNTVKKAITYVNTMSDRGVNVRVIYFLYALPSLSIEEIDGLKAAINESNKRKILIVANAGTSNLDLDNPNNKRYPANLGLENIITVTGVAKTGALTANYGATSVHIAAPGKEIYSAINGDSHGNIDGGVPATAYVAGIASLIFGEDPNLTPRQVRDILIATRTELSSLSGKTVSGGIANASTALAKVLAERNVVVSGKVTMNGYPLSGIKVRGYFDATRNPSAYVVASTDSYGVYKFEKIVPNYQYRIAPEYSVDYTFHSAIGDANEISGTLYSSRADANFRAVSKSIINLPKYSISGTVSIYNHPLAGITVTTTCGSNQVADANGNYKIENIPRGASCMLVPAADARVKTSSLITQGVTNIGSNKVLNFDLQPGDEAVNNIVGYVLNKAGKGVAGAKITMYLYDNTTADYVLYTNSDGRFTKALPYGVNYRVIAQLTNYFFLDSNGQALTEDNFPVTSLECRKSYNDGKPCVFSVRQNKIVADTDSNGDGKGEVVIPYGNAKTNLAFRIYNRRTGNLTLYYSNSNQLVGASKKWKKKSKRIVGLPMDMTGDGISDKVSYHNGSWLYSTKNMAGIAQVGAVNFGPSSSYVPVPGRYYGNQCVDLALYRKKDGLWLRKNCATQEVKTVNFAPLGRPVPGDYDGDGFTDLAVYYAATGEWKIKPSSDPYNSISFIARKNSIPLAFDNDGDGKDDAVLYSANKAFGTYYFYYYNSNYKTEYYYNFGQPGDLPLVLSLDGDMYADVAIYRPSENAVYYYKTTNEGTGKSLIEKIVLPRRGSKKYIP